MHSQSIRPEVEAALREAFEAATARVGPFEAVVINSGERDGYVVHLFKEPDINFENEWILATSPAEDFGKLVDFKFRT